MTKVTEMARETGEGDVDVAEAEATSAGPTMPLRTTKGKPLSIPPLAAHLWPPPLFHRCGRWLSEESHVSPNDAAGTPGQSSIRPRDAGMPSSFGMTDSVTLPTVVFHYGRGKLPHSHLQLSCAGRSELLLFASLTPTDGCRPQTPAGR